MYFGQELDNIINEYRETKKILMIITDFERHDQVRNTLLQSTSVKQFIQMQNFVEDLEEKGIKQNLPSSN